jgi:hypothetical protein
VSFHVPEKFRVTDEVSHPQLNTTAADGNNGAFRLQLNTGAAFAIASEGMGWEHVSVSRPDRCLTWDEMCQVKALFWDDEDCVVQYHPPKSEYVNMHPHCLHLWRPTAGEIIMPPKIMVGL